MSIKDIQIGNKTIGLDKNIFISAEVGTTCNGDLETAKKIIDAAVLANMDAVKFQVLNPDKKFSDHNLPFSYIRHTGEKVTENIYQMLKGYVFSFEEWQEIKDYADEKGIICFATPDHLEAIDLMEKLDMPAFKVSSWDITYEPFIRKIAQTQKPIIFDLGPADTKELLEALKICREQGNDKIIVLHCFHTNDFAQMNLKTIQYVRETFDVLTGFSAPDQHNEIDYLSLAFEPVLIEKRLTLNRKNPRHHHAVALEPAEMNEYVKKIRELEQAAGKYGLVVSQADKQKRMNNMRRIVAVRQISKGDVLTKDNIDCRRPEKGGLSPIYHKVVLGRKVKKDLKENEPITWDKI